jgi:hypothetical protein
MIAPAEAAVQTSNKTTIANAIKVSSEKTASIALRSISATCLVRGQQTAQHSLAQKYNRAEPQKGAAALTNATSELRPGMVHAALNPLSTRLAHGTVRDFRQGFTLSRSAIGSHACSLHANMRVTNGISLGSPLLLPVDTVNCVQTLKVRQLWHAVADGISVLQCCSRVQLHNEQSGCEH